MNNGKDFIITLQYVKSTDKTTLTISDAGKETPLSKVIDTLRLMRTNTIAFLMMNVLLFLIMYLT